MKQKQKFSFSMPIVKAYIQKGTNKRILEGVASTTDKDLHGDRMSPAAIQTMADSIKALKKKNGGTLNAEHDKSWMAELGDIVDLSVDNKDRLVMKAELDDSPLANTLWYKLTEQKKKLGLSIGGFVKSFRIEIDEKTKEYMRVFEDIVLDHIAVVSQPANPNTWVSAIAKSVNGVQTGAIADQQEEVEFNLLTNQDEMTKKKAQDTELEKDEKIEEEETQDTVSEGDSEVVEETTTEGEAEETTTEEAEEAKTEEVAEEKAEEVAEEATTEEAEGDKEPEQEEKSFATKSDLSAMKTEILEAMKALLSKGEESTEEKVEEEAEEEVETETEKAKKPKAGDACTMDDGSAGTMSMKNGKMVCGPAKKSVEEEESTEETVEKSQLEKDVEFLKSEVEKLSKVAVTKRKTAVEVEKFEGEGGEEATKETLEKELSEVEKSLAGDPNAIFAKKGEIRRKYAKLGIK